MTILLVKGQKTDLTKSYPALSQIAVGMGWQNANNSVEVDFSAFLLGSNSKVIKDEDLIFYGNPQGPNGSISVKDGNKQSYAGIVDRTQLAVNLSAIPSQYERISFALTIYEGEKRGQNFSQLDDTYIRIIDATSGAELIRYDIGKSFAVETAIVVGELYRYNGEWKFNANGSGYSGGLQALCNSYGVEVKEETGNSSPTPQPQPEPAANQSAPTPPPVNLNKIELKKRGDVINLQKGTGPIGEILINLNWNKKKSTGWFGGNNGVDLDLGCLYELKDGSKGTVQALGKSFGALNRFPYISLDGDDRTGAISTGENLRINGKYVSEIKRVVIYAFIYKGITKWTEADGVVIVKQSGGPDIEVRLDEHDNRKGMCAIAMIKNVNDQTFSIERLVEYFSGHQELDNAYNWGIRWRAGSK